MVTMWGGMVTMGSMGIIVTMEYISCINNIINGKYPYAMVILQIITIHTTIDKFKVLL